MGFLWSKPSGPLTDALIVERPVFLRMGDLVLVSASDMDVALHAEPWKHVGLVLSSEHIFCRGQMLPLRAFLAEHGEMYLRALECARPSDFETRLTTAVSQAMRAADGSDIGYVLAEMGFIEDNASDTLRPEHFSVTSRRLNLQMYAPDVMIIDA
tara:strand:- start:237 stop:701 length:465 start_codon:yes stop_codon:yes gene_type:complete